MKTCKECNQDFKPNYKKQTYCSRGCSSLVNGRKGADKTRGVKTGPLKQSVKDKIRKAKTGVSIWGGKRETPWMIGENNHKWAGDNVGYDALHDWISRYGIKTGSCQHCGTSKQTKDGRAYTHWANVSRKYKRDLGDYIELCPSCHLYLDRNNLTIKVHKN